MYLVRAFLGAAIAVVGLSAPSQAVLVNFTNADLGHNVNTTGATTVDVGTVVVTQDPLGVADLGTINAVIYTVSDPSLGGDVGVTVSVSSTSGHNVVDFTASRSEIPNVPTGGNVTLSGAITSVPAGFNATFNGFTQIDFESLSGGEDTTITSGTATTAVLDSSASGDRFILADEFAGVAGDPGTYTTFTLNHDSSSTGSWDLRDWDFSISVTAVPEPSSFAMLGLCGLIYNRRRRNR